MSATPTLTIDRVLAELARQQLGLLSLKQVMELGFDSKVLERRAQAGVLHRLFPNIYADLAVMATAEQRTLAAWLAVWDARKGISVAISGQSAAVIHGFPIRPNERHPIDLVVHDDRRFRINGIHVRRTLVKPKTDPWFCARITTPAQTICDVAASVSKDSLARCVDHALVNRTATVDAISGIALGRSPAGFSGRRKLLTVLEARSNGQVRHRSGDEQRIGRWLVDAGFGSFQPNFVIAEADDLEVDFAWECARVALEYSPFFTHGSERSQARDMERRRLAALAGWTILEATDAHGVSFAAFRPITETLRVLLGRASEFGHIASLRVAM
jgi:hypothetical protein